MSTVYSAPTGLSSSSSCDCDPFESLLEIAEDILEEKTTEKNQKAAAVAATLPFVEAAQAGVTTALKHIDEGVYYVNDAIEKMKDTQFECAKYFTDFNNVSVDRNQLNAKLMQNTEIANAIKLGLAAEAFKAANAATTAFQVWVNAKQALDVAQAAYQAGEFPKVKLDEAQLAYDNATKGMGTAKAALVAAQQQSAGFIPSTLSNWFHLAPTFAEWVYNRDTEMQNLFKPYYESVRDAFQTQEATEKVDSLRDGWDSLEQAYLQLSIARTNRDEATENLNHASAQWQRAQWNVNEASKALSNCENSPTCDGGEPSQLPQYNCLEQTAAYNVGQSQLDLASLKLDQTLAGEHSAFSKLSPAATAANIAYQELRSAANDYLTSLNAATVNDELFVGPVKQYSGTVPLLGDLVEQLGVTIISFALEWEDLQGFAAVGDLLKFADAFYNMMQLAQQLLDLCSTFESCWKSASDFAKMMALASAAKMKSDNALTLATSKLLSANQNWKTLYGAFIDTIASWLSAFNSALAAKKNADAADEAFRAAQMALNACEELKAAFQ